MENKWKKCVTFFAHKLVYIKKKQYLCSRKSDTKSVTTIDTKSDTKSDTTKEVSKMSQRSLIILILSSIRTDSHSVITVANNMESH